MSKTLAISLLLLCPIWSFSQTKIASHIPDSYVVDLKELATKKGRKNKSKAEKKKLKKRTKEFKEELRLKSKLYKLKTDSLTKIRRVLKDTATRRKALAKLESQKSKMADNKHLKRLDKKGRLGKVQQVGKQYGDYLQQVKQDSVDVKGLSNKALQQVDNEEVKKYTQSIEALQKDSLDVKALGQAALDLADREEIQKYTGQLELKEFDLDSGFMETPPPFVMEALGEELAEMDKMRALEKQIKGMPQMLNQKKPEVGTMKGQDFMKQLQLKEKLGEDFDPKYVDIFEEHQEKLVKAQETVKGKKLKNGWKETINALFDQDMDEIKRESFKDRLHIAGLVQITSFQPFAMDANPSIGYHFTDRITAGVGGRYRLQLEEENRAYSYQLFTDYRISYSFYLHAEYENLSQKMPEIGWRSTNNYFIGLGRDINYRNYLKATMLVLYNFSSEVSEQDFRERISVRFGFRIN